MEIIKKDNRIKANNQTPLIYFPQISRRIPTWLQNFDFKAMLLILFISLIGLNITTDSKKYSNNQKQLHFAVLRHPYSSTTHEKLGQYYLDKNREFAESEYILAQEYYLEQKIVPFADVLGQKSTPRDTWLNIEKEKEQVRSQIEYWYKIQEKYPDYSYSLLKQASLYYVLDEKLTSKGLLERVLITNPNDKTAVSLLRKLSSP